MRALGWLAHSACGTLEPFWQQSGAIKLGTLIFWLLAVIPLLFPSPQNNASKLLLAIMESRHDSENAERILYNMRPKELVSAGVTPELLALHLHRRQGSESSLCPKSRVWGLLMYGLVKTQAGDPKCSQSIADLSLCSGLRWSWGQNVAQGQRGWPGICYLQGNMRLSLLCQLLGCS